MGGIDCIHRLVYYICSRFFTNVMIALMVSERERMGAGAMGGGGWVETVSYYCPGGT